MIFQDAGGFVGHLGAVKPLQKMQHRVDAERNPSSGYYTILVDEAYHHFVEDPTYGTACGLIANSQRLARRRATDDPNGA